MQQEQKNKAPPPKQKSHSLWKHTNETKHEGKHEFSVPGSMLNKKLGLIQSAVIR